jgi:hypothetical protein
MQLDLFTQEQKRLPTYMKANKPQALIIQEVFGGAEIEQVLGDVVELYPYPQIRRVGDHYFQTIGAACHDHMMFYDMDCNGSIYLHHQFSSFPAQQYFNNETNSYPPIYTITEICTDIAI